MMKLIPILGLLMMVLLAGCRQETEPTPEATPTPNPPVGITYCDINPSDLCLEGFGLDVDDRLLILFKAEDLHFADIYINTDGPEGEMLFDCQQSENFLENVYCLGDRFPEGELIKMNIYSQDNDRLIAIGVFEVQYGDLPAPDVVFEVEGTATPFSGSAPATTPTTAASYPNPEYPNPAYPNPTSTPRP